MEIKKRMCFFLDEAKKIAMNEAELVEKPTRFVNAPAVMQQCIINYKDHEFEPLEQGKNFPNNDQPTECAIDASVHLLAGSLLGSLVVFDDQTFYITSCDIFVHNDLALDDCAYIMNAQDYHAEPTAKIKMKSYMGSTNHYELTVLHGFFEVLVVGCVYYSRSNEKVSVNLGSSLTNWKYGTMESKAIYISTFTTSSSSQAISTPRLLKNYLRRNANNAWGLHLPAYFISGLIPAVPISFVSHRSQLN